MDVATSNDNQHFGLKAEDSVGDRRKSSAVAAARRKASAVARNGEEAVAIVEGAQLSEEDKRLAEMGYIQVSYEFTKLARVPILLTLQPRYTSGNSHGSRVSPSPSPSPVCSRVSRRHLSTPCTQEVLPLPCGAGSSPAPGVCA